MTICVDRLYASIEQPVLITRCVFHTLLQWYPSAEFPTDSVKPPSGPHTTYAYLLRPGEYCWTSQYDAY